MEPSKMDNIETILKETSELTGQLINCVDVLNNKIRAVSEENYQLATRLRNLERLIAVMSILLLIGVIFHLFSY